MQYFKFNFLKEESRLPVNNNYFDYIFIIPDNNPIKHLGQFLESLIDFKKNYHPNNSVLILWMQNGDISGETKLESFWEYFKQKNTFTPPVKEFCLGEITFSKAIKSNSAKLETVLKAIKNVTFSYGMVYTPSFSNHLSSFKINQLFENAILNNSDLNLASYVIPFYKGIMINFWMMPLAYFFGRKIRNPGTPDFIFSKKCFNFWMRQEFPDLKYLTSIYLHLILSTLSSGLRITEFFLGEKDLDSIYGVGIIPELIHTGLNLIVEYKMFIKNSTSLINTRNMTSSTVPFNIYSASDIDGILKFYEKNKSFSGRKFLSLAKKNLKNENFKKINVYLQHNLKMPQNVEEYGYSWNDILLTMIQEYLNVSSKKKQKEIEQLFIHLYSFKPKLWSEEIKRMMVSTKEKAQHDALRGHPWHGGLSGEHWHIHDSFEKKLHEELIRVCAFKTKFLN